jgi:D-sedoheptulose 7-phosphate isomerase
MNLKYEKYWDEMQGVIKKLPHDEIKELQSLVRELPNKEGKLIIIGNGGSASTAEHASCDLSKGLITKEPNKRFQAISLTSNMALLTAWSNDTAYDEALKNLFLSCANRQDILLAISGSGKSRNIINTIVEAKKLNIFTVGLTGFDGGEMKRIVDLEIHIDSSDMQVVENLHLAVIHALIKD